MVVHEGEKMSKSLGNLVFVADLLRCHDPMALRLLLLSHHYRRSWSWDPRLPTTADDRLKRWRAAKNNTESPTLVGQIGALLDDDLDAPGALAVIAKAVTQGQGAKTAAACLGVVL